MDETKNNCSGKIFDRRFAEMKTEIREWMLEHPQEYSDFVAVMNSPENHGIQILGQIAKDQIKGFEDMVALQISVAEPDFASLIEPIMQSDVLRQFFEEEDDLRNAALAWLLFGRTYENVVEHLEEMIASSRYGGYRWILTLLVKFIIRRSIRSGNRTKADWENYRNYRASVGEVNIAESVNLKEQAKSIPTTIRRSFSEIFANDSDIINRIGEWVTARHFGNDEAYLIIALKELGYPVDNTHEFHEAIVVQFPDVRFVGLRAVQKQLKLLETVVGMGRHAPKDKGKDREIIDTIKQFLLD